MLTSVSSAADRPLTICYRGNFQPDQPEPWSTESQIAATLEGMGHRVVRAQEIGGQAWDWRRTTDACLNEQADLFLWTTTVEPDPEAAYASLDQLRAYGIPSASYHLDLWWGISRQVQLLDHPFFRADFVFTADGGHQRQFRRIGINHFWAEPAAYRAACTSAPRTDGRWPLIFVGSLPYPHLEHAEARRSMVAWLQQRYPNQFRVYNGGYRNYELTKLIASATVVAGDSCLAGHLPYYWSERIPETLGRAGFLVHPYVPGLEHSYTDGEHLRWYDAEDLAQLDALVGYYLNHPAAAHQIGFNGQQHVLEHHCYEHRLEQVLATVLGCDNGGNKIPPKVTPPPAASAVPGADPGTGTAGYPSGPDRVAEDDQEVPEAVDA